MSLGPLIVDIAGVDLTASDRELLTHPLVGGVIFFSRNYQSPKQLKNLVQAIHHLRKPHLLTMVDHEGGTVQRFRHGFTQLPSAAQLGYLYQHHPEQCLQLACDTGWLLAIELRACGLDHSLMPVLDLEQPHSQLLRGRTYHQDGHIVATLAQAIMSGLREAGMQATGKHFPGHGGVVQDSHDTLPIDDRPYQAIQADLLPFQRMIDQGLAGIMPAHVIYQQIDRWPAGFSAVWLQDILRKQMGFQGAVLSDDLSMRGAQIAGGYTERVKAALACGCDAVLICNQPQAVMEVIDALPVTDDPIRYSRLAHLHGRPVAGVQAYHRLPRWKKTIKAIADLIEKFPMDD